MKKLNLLGKSLSKEEQQLVLGADGPVRPVFPGEDGCFNLGDDCNDNVQCCSTVCRAPGGPATGKLCWES